MNIIFIHRSKSWYLTYTINQTIYSNPKANIILLGDESNNVFSGIRHYKISDFSKKANDFKKIYKHFSMASFDFELFCIQRWFILYEFMEHFNLSKAMLVDTDVLIFQPIEDYLSLISTKYHFTQAMGFVNVSDLKYLKKMCDFITNQYVDNDNLRKLEKEYINWKLNNNAGGISDITLFSLYEKDNKDCFYNMDKSVIANKTFLYSIIDDNNKQLSLKWINSIPYVELNKKWVGIVGIHLFGLQKQYIRKLYQGKYWILARLIYFWKKSFIKRFLKRL